MASKRASAKRRAETEDQEIGSSLFDDDGSIDHIAIERLDPDEGFLGTMDPSSTESDIRARYGGGKFRVRARDASSRFVKGIPVANIQIGGDPVFQSVAFERTWKRRQGLLEEKPANGGGGGAISEKPLGFGELMLLMSKGTDAARQEAREAAELRAREADRAHERQIALLREETARREKELMHERERLDREAQEREARMQREAAAERERAREHTAAMLQLVTEKAKSAEGGGGGVQTLIAGMKLAQDMGAAHAAGGEEPDPLTMFAAKIPEILEAGGRLMALDAAGRPRPRLIKPAEPTPGAPAAGKDNVVLEGAIAKKARRLIAHLEAQGKDPEAIFSRAFDVLAKTKKAPPAAPPAAPIARKATKPAPARAAARRAAPRRAPTPAAPKSPPKKKAATVKR